MVTQHYIGILSRSNVAFDQLAADQERYIAFTKAHNDAGDLDQLEVLLSGRPEAKMYALARLEYQHALFSAGFSQYRQAHVSLRLFLELSLCSILFSAHEIDAQLWLKGQKDSNWAAIVSKEVGVLSKQFVGAFFEDMKEHSEQYRVLGEKLYRECSEYVHGNHQSYEGIDAEISFNGTVFDAWADRADTARLVVKFAFVCRFLNQSSVDKNIGLEALIMDSFGTLAPVQAVFEKDPK